MGLQHHKSPNGGWLALIILGSSIVGCPPAEEEITRIGPPDDSPKEEVIARVNQNSAGMNFLLKGVGDADGEYTHPDGRREKFQLRTLMLYRRPQKLYMEFNHDLQGTMMEVGSNNRESWVWWKQDDRQYWWGEHNRLTTSSYADIPVRPDHLSSVLGLAKLPTNENDYIFKVKNDHYEYMFIDRDDLNNPYNQKTVYIDRWQPFLIREIVFSDEYGKEVMRAKLSHYETIEGSNVRVPHRIKLYGPGDKYKIDLDFKKITRFDKPAAEVKFISPMEQGKKNLGIIKRIDERSGSLDAPSLGSTP